MGMDLEPQAPTNEAPICKYSNGVKWGRYNWAGWRWLLDYLDDKGLDLSEFAGSNDGDLISDETCKKVANLIEEGLPALDDEYREWLTPHVQLWRTCGGYRQY